MLLQELFLHTGGLDPVRPGLARTGNRFAMEFLTDQDGVVFEWISVFVGKRDGD
jgi:hypothetical protein